MFLAAPAPEEKVTALAPSVADPHLWRYPFDWRKRLLILRIEEVFVSWCRTYWYRDVVHSGALVRGVIVPREALWQLKGIITK